MVRSENEICTMSDHALDRIERIRRRRNLGVLVIYIIVAIVFSAAYVAGYLSRRAL